MRAIYKRELRSCFHSMIGYVFIAFLTAFAGIYFMAYNLNYGYPYFSYVLSGITFIFLIAIPLLTMRSFSEEQKSKTDQLLLTSPVSLFEIVMGKYLAMVTILAVPCVIYLIFPLIIKAQGTAYILADYLSIMMFFLLGCVYIAIGMFVSALTQSQILAAIGTFAILLILYLWEGILEFLPNSAMLNAVGVAAIFSVVVFLIWEMTKNWVISVVLELGVIVGNIIAYVTKSSVYEGLLADVLGQLNLTEIFTGISSDSLLDVSGIILYLSLIVLFIVLTMQMIQKRRWS
ncbi:MAG: ABC transporter permease subunit [Lachnospiraceae bacterium]